MASNDNQVGRKINSSQGWGFESLACYMHIKRAKGYGVGDRGSGFISLLKIPFILKHLTQMQKDTKDQCWVRSFNDDNLNLMKRYDSGSLRSSDTRQKSVNLKNVSFKSQDRDY